MTAAQGPGLRDPDPHPPHTRAGVLRTLWRSTRSLVHDLLEVTFARFGWLLGRLLTLGNWPDCSFADAHELPIASRLLLEAIGAVLVLVPLWWWLG